MPPDTCVIAISCMLTQVMDNEYFPLVRNMDRTVSDG